MYSSYTLLFLTLSINPCAFSKSSPILVSWNILSKKCCLSIKLFLLGKGNFIIHFSKFVVFNNCLIKLSSISKKTVSYLSTKVVLVSFIAFIFFNSLDKNSKYGCLNGKNIFLSSTVKSVCSFNIFSKSI